MHEAAINATNALDIPIPTPFNDEWSKQLMGVAWREINLVSPTAENIGYWLLEHPYGRVLVLSEVSALEDLGDS